MGNKSYITQILAYICALWGDEWEMR